MKHGLNPYKDAICQCNKMSAFLHEVAQSLLVIQAYANGCKERLKENILDNKQLTEALSVINEHTELIGTKIHCFNPSKLLSVDK